MVCPSGPPSVIFRVPSILRIILGTFALECHRMITNITGCVAYNACWHKPISWSFSRDFVIKLPKYEPSYRVILGRGNLCFQGRSGVTAIKLLKYIISCRVRPTARAVLDRLFPHLAQTITKIKEYVTFWYKPISSRWFNRYFAIKLLKHATSFVRSTTGAFLYAFFPYLAQLIINIRWCVACIDLGLYIQTHSPVTLQ